MIEYALIFGFAATGIALSLNAVRLVQGPDVVDRALALDTLFINAIGLIMLIGIWFATSASFEAAVLIAMVGFVSTVAFCKFLLRGDVIE